MSNDKRGSVLAFAAVALAALSVGCIEDSIDSLKGRWDGRIICRGGLVSNVSVGFDVQGTSITGTVITRTLGTNKEWQAKGTDIRCNRWIECLDDSCSSDQECVAKHEGVPDTPEFGPAECPEVLPDKVSGAPTCNTSYWQCTPCVQYQSYSRILVTMMDDNDLIKDPILNLAREGDNRLDGTVSEFCADEQQLGPPRVELEKDRP